MSMQERLDRDLKDAMKARDQLRMDVIRMIKAAIFNKELALKKELDDAEMSRVMTALVKQRKEAAELYQKAKRDDLAGKELQEIVIIEGYLPQAPSPEAVEQMITTVIHETGARSLKDMGLVIKTVMAKLAGQTVDGKQISDIVRAKLQ